MGLMHFADPQCVPQLVCRPGVKIEVSVRVFAGVTQDSELTSRVLRDEIGHVVHLAVGVQPTAGGCVVLFYLFKCENVLFLSFLIFSSSSCPSFAPPRATDSLHRRLHCCRRALRS